MKYIKYTGKNGFQTYGFIKDNSHKLDQWKMRFSRISNKRSIRMYSYKIERNVVASEGEYIYVDESADYAVKFKVSKRNPFLLILIGKIKALINESKSHRYNHEIEKFLND